MKHLTTHLLSILILASSTAIHGQLNIDAQLRTRAEYRHGYQQLFPDGAVPTLVISQQTRLSLKYNSESLRFTFTPQDVRTWGDETTSSSTGVFGDGASLDVLEAFAELNAGRLGWISVGRQQLVYDNERLLASRSWNQNGIAYDAVVLKSSIHMVNIDAGISWNSAKTSLTDNLYDPSRIKSLNFIHLNREINENSQISAIHIASGSTETDSTNTLHFRQTTGLYAESKPGLLKLQAGAYYQFGRNNKNQSVRAFLFDGDCSVNSRQISAGAGLSYLSGDRNLNDNTDRLFDVLYGARHRYFGQMDYFSSFARQTAGGGLSDIYFYIKITPAKGWKLSNTFHTFSLASTNNTTPDSRFLGFENDLILNGRISNQSAVHLGIMTFHASENLEILQQVANPGPSHFIYLALILKPTLFSEKNSTN